MPSAGAEMALRLAEPLSIWEIQDEAPVGHHGFYQGTYTGQIFKSMKPQDALYGDPQELQSLALMISGLHSLSVPQGDHAGPCRAAAQMASVPPAS